jgi:hypothetical protein
VVEVQAAGFWVEVLLRGLRGGFGRVGGLREWGRGRSGLGCGNGLRLTGGRGGFGGGLWAGLVVGR